MNKEVKGETKRNRAMITGCGSCAPKTVLSNAELSCMVETNDEWITTRTGIKNRHISKNGETTASLATEAAKKAIEMAGISAKELDMVIVGTITPEMVFPSTAAFVQGEIGARNAVAFDLSAACSGFTFGLSIGQQFIETGMYNKILVIGSETLSKITNWNDRGSCILFGDGAGAVVLERTQEDKGILYSTMSSDGTSWDVLCCQAYGSRYPTSEKLADPDMIYMSIRGREVYQQAVRRIVETVNECLDKCGLKVEDLNMLVSHQMNARIIESAAKRLKLPDERIFINIDEYGNTSAASIPIAFDECFRSGRIKSGDHVLFVAFGAGLTWGANIIRF